MTAKFSASSDGTKVTIGNAAEDALQIDSTAKTIKALAPYVLSAPVQTWQRLDASRALNTSYTNNGKSPIKVSVSIEQGASFANYLVTVSSIDIATISIQANALQSYSFEVPVGAGYAVNITSGANGTLTMWSELK